MKRAAASVNASQPVRHRQRELPPQRTPSETRSGRLRLVLIRLAQIRLTLRLLKAGAVHGVWLTQVR